MTESFFGGRNWNGQRKQQTCCKSLTNLTLGLINELQAVKTSLNDSDNQIQLNLFKSNLLGTSLCVQNRQVHEFRSNRLNEHATLLIGHFIQIIHNKI
jgi:hypothetical protein